MSVVTYFISNGALTCQISGVEKGYLFARENDHALIYLEPIFVPEKKHYLCKPKAKADNCIE